MTDETRAELRRKVVRAAIESIIRQESIGWPWEVRTRPPHQEEPEDVWATPEPPEPPPLTTAQQLALSVLLGDESVLPQALADYLLDQGHEYATAIRDAERERIACMVVAIAGHDHRDDESPQAYDSFNALMHTASRIRNGEKFEYEWGV